ncbi:MAG: prepilin-type N-terminal cleavage/methylation domain-containing protein [Steroidobacteraceae bacterium]
MKGFTMVETLIATALLGTVAAAGLTGLLQASAAAQHIAAEQTLQERAEYALATLAADIQMAGYFGFAAPAGNAGAAAVPLACGAELLGGALRGLEVQPRYTLSCAAAGRGSVPGSPVLVLRRASTQTAAPEAGRVQWYSNLAEPEHNRLLWNGVLPPALPLTNHGELRNLVVRAFYIARSSDGDNQTPSLRVKSLTAIAGNPAFIDTEVMPGVMSLRVEPVPDERHPTAVQIVLGLQRESAARSGTQASAASSFFTRHLALRNAPES